MRVLLDTHAFIWWIADSRRLSAIVRGIIADDANDIFVSAASAWEITIKYHLGKLPESGTLALDVTGGIANQGFTELEITVADGARAGSLPDIHSDPFDRMLIAQALGRNLGLVSIDKVFDRYGINRVW